MANKLCVDKALDYILLPDGIESDLEEDDEWEDEMMKVDDNLNLDYNPDLDINAGPLEVEADNLIEIADVMSRNRFQVFLRYIHFNDNAEMKPRDHPDYNPLFKVSPLLKRLRDAMSYLEPEERHSVDEQMISFKGLSE